MTRTAFVAGAGGAVGEATALALRRAGWRVVASMRTRRADAIARLEAAGARVVSHDLPGDNGWARDAAGCEALVFTTHLSITLAALDAAPSVRRIVVFSSNNVAADADAPSYRALAQVEAAVRARFAHAAIIRPTLIYGDVRLATLTRLIQLARRSPVLPLPGSGRALVQPVFHGDLGALAAGLAEGDAPRGVFAAGGPDILTMRDLYRQAARAAGSRPLVISTPANFLAALKLISSEQAARAETDRSAIGQDELPAAFIPRTPLSVGLAHHARTVFGAPGGG